MIVFPHNFSLVKEHVLLNLFSFSDDNKIFPLCHIALQARALHLRSCFIILQFNYVPVRLVCRLSPRVAAVCSYRVMQNRARRYRALFLKKKSKSSNQVSNLGFFGVPCCDISPLLFLPLLSSSPVPR